MSETVGHSMLYNFIILFIIVVFAIVAGTLSYYKAFKINNKIVGAIEKYEGFNSGSVSEINYFLSALGYSTATPNCPETFKGMTRVNYSHHYYYCIYISNPNPGKGTKYNYGVLTFMKLDLPVVNQLKINVFTKTNDIYKFTTSAQPTS